MACKPKPKPSKPRPKGKARKPAKSPAVLAAAERAEARSRGEKITEPRVPIDPVIVKGEKTVEDVTPGKGRPTDYDPSYVDEVRVICERGATDIEIAEHFGVTPRTIYRWKLQHADFCQAMQVGKDLADDRVERAFFMRAAGYTFIEQQALKIKTSRDTEDVKVVDVEKHVPADTTAAMKWLSNRRGDKWRDTQRHEHTGRDGGAIEIAETGDIAQARRVAFAMGRALERQRLKVIDVDAAG